MAKDNHENNHDLKTKDESQHIGAKFEDVMLEEGAVVAENGGSDNKSCGKLASLAAPLLASKHPLPPSPSLLQRARHALLCPPHGTAAHLLTLALCCLAFWAAAYAVLGRVALPGTTPLTVTIEGGSVFSVLALLLAALVSGWAVQLLHLPALLGMMVSGILLSNLPGLEQVGRGLDPAWSAALRSMALAVILLRAGLGLDPAALRRLSGMVLRLAFLPCLVEAGVVMLASRLLLSLPWLWGAMLGFLLAAVSPAVVVPCLLQLQEQGWGTAKGIPTLVIAAASLDDVLAISCFTVLLGITFHPSASVTSSILQGPLEAVVGVAGGALWGGVATFFPPQPSPSPSLRLTVLGSGALLALFGSPLVGLPGSGALAVLTMGFTAGLGWRRQEGGEGGKSVSTALATMWMVFQPLLFSFIGTEIRVSALEISTVGWGLLVLLCGLLLRLLASCLAVLGGDLTSHERFFVSLAWLPKATVQAALGPLALDTAREALAVRFPGSSCAGDDASLGAPQVLGLAGGVVVEPSELESLCSMVGWGQELLTIAVLVILVTAPLGAVAIVVGGPRLLAREGEPGHQA